MGWNIISTMARIRKTIRKINIILIGALIILSALILLYPFKLPEKIKTSEIATVKGKIHGIVLPHHLLVETFIDKFYHEVSINRPDIKDIILISPNHFFYGFEYIQGETKNLEKEHGIMNELPFIKKYFPKAKVTPYTIKPGTPQNRLDPLISEISKKNSDNTLIIASIDFSHYESEAISESNDAKTVMFLQKLNTLPKEENIFDDIKTLSISHKFASQESVAIDSPETLYVLVKLMELQNSETFHLWKRTSTLSLTNIKDPLQNTSHIFGFFVE